MIDYGTRGTPFAASSLPHASCPACRVRGGLQAGLISHYTHLGGVPLFPSQKTAVVQCAACGVAWPASAWPAPLALALRKLRQQHPHPYWTWSGVLLLVLAGLATYLYSVQDTRRDEALLAAPRTGDIYTVRSDSANAYTLLKVLRAGGNGVELVANQYQSPESHPIDSLNQEYRYSKEPFIITRLDLQIMRRKGELTDVDRPGL